jgi:hypothetical protein
MTSGQSRILPVLQFYRPELTRTTVLRRDRGLCRLVQVLWGVWGWRASGGEALGCGVGAAHHTLPDITQQLQYSMIVFTHLVTSNDKIVYYTFFIAPIIIYFQINIFSCNYLISFVNYLLVLSVKIIQYLLLIFKFRVHSFFVWYLSCYSSLLF